ncbi:hypothetical protein ACFW6K_00330 [Streptomyces sp. NPDC058733]|uniref:hypothetical protein n=1 Tax=Streptomyces sp. NPDC058733 TaxID=3346614 RepID=UPI00368A481B
MLRRPPNLRVSPLPLERQRQFLKRVCLLTREPLIPIGLRRGRAEGETRTGPGHPALTRILRQHIEDEQLQPGDLLNSMAVLLATYARCVDGQLPDLKRRLEAAGDLPEPPGAG